MVATIATISATTTSTTSSSNGSSSSNAGTTSSRIVEFLHTMPPTTLFIMMLCWFIYIVIEMILELPSSDMHQITFSVHEIVYHQQIYRIFTHVLFHSNTNILHIVMNMMSLLNLGTILESQLFGTTRFFYTILFLSPIATACIHIVLAFIEILVLQSNTILLQQSIGISGVLFQLIVLQCNLLQQNNSPHVFGMIRVPSYLYPWVLLIVLQIIAPNLSFIGHLSGILVGTIQVQYKQSFQYWLYPTEQYFVRCDLFCSRYLPQILQHPRFTPTQSTLLFPSLPNRSDTNTLITQFSTSMSYMIRQINCCFRRFPILWQQQPQDNDTTTATTIPDDSTKQSSETISLLV